MSETQYPQSQVTPLVTAGAYAVGMSIGGLLTFNYVVPVSGGSAIIQGASVTFASGVVPNMDLVMLSQTPTGGTITDHAALVIAPGDLAKVIGVLHLTDATLLGAAAPSVMQATAAVMPFDLRSGTVLHGVLVARTAVTLGSTTDVVVSLNVLWG
jgi:hypothetical protein